MAEKEKNKFSHPNAPGADQSTTFIEVKFDENSRAERERPNVSKKSVTRGENRFSDYPSAC